MKYLVVIGIISRGDNVNIDKLRKLRETKGLMQKEVASLLGISPQCYSSWETGTREPDNRTLKQIAVFFDISLDYLLDITDEPISLANVPQKTPLPTLEESILSNNELSEESKKDLITVLNLVKIRDEPKTYKIAAMNGASEITLTTEQRKLLGELVKEVDNSNSDNSDVF